jgi:hypothetical protein
MGWTGQTPPYHKDKKKWLEDEFRQVGEVGTNPSFELTDVLVKMKLFPIKHCCMVLVLKLAVELLLTVIILTIESLQLLLLMAINFTE